MAVSLHDHPRREIFERINASFAGPVVVEAVEAPSRPVVDDWLCAGCRGRPPVG